MKVSEQISMLLDVGSVDYISRERAAELFSQQFGVELFDLLEFNPLQSSLVVTLREDADPSESWEKTAKAIAVIDNVEDVVFEGDLLAEVNRFYKTAGKGIGFAVGMALAVSILFTILSVQSVIRQREEFIQIITLSGGTSWMARGPFVALGGYYGIISGIAASCMLASFGWFIEVGWGIGSVFPVWWIPALIMGGVCISMISAGWAAGRRIRKV